MSAELFQHADMLKLPHVMPIANEYASMDHIRGVLYQYQQQSPAHFELAIEALELENTSINEPKSRIEHPVKLLDILIEGNSVEGRIAVQVTCCVASVKRGAKAGSMQCTIVMHDRRENTLEQFLSSSFPVADTRLQPDSLWRWWQKNGQSFNWAALATELKERIIEFCMHQPRDYGVYRAKLARFVQRYKNDHDLREQGPLEIVEQLGDWYQLLYVSHQLRAIALRLCVTVCSSLPHSNGLCITASSMRSFSERLDRLGDYYQMVEPNSVPKSCKEQALSKCYSRFPRIYPELRQYATFRHGIQKISLAMGFLSSMRFFEVNTGGVQRFPKARDPTYHVFERLPNLNEIVIRLPLRPRKGWKNNPYTGGPALFHHESPCPRILHRIVYERIANVLASHEKVILRNFIDDHEEERFLLARKVAIEALKFTRAELNELYADASGGVDLPYMDREVKSPDKVKQGDAELAYPEDFHDGFFPPSCQCDRPCAMSLVFMLSEIHR